MTGGKPKFDQINRGLNQNLLNLPGDKPKFSQITGGEICHEGPKPNKFQITRTKSKKNYFTEEKPKMTYITGNKALLTLK